jgi:hypothetical protein
MKVGGWKLSIEDELWECSKDSIEQGREEGRWEMYMYIRTSRFTLVLEKFPMSPADKFDLNLYLES